MSVKMISRFIIEQEFTQGMYVFFNFRRKAPTSRIGFRKITHNAACRFNRFAVLAAVLLCIAPLAGCGSSRDVWMTDPVGVTDYKLNTYVAIDAYSTGGYSSGELKNILTDALSLCDTYENMYSRTLQTSELYRLNSGEITVVSQQLGDLIATGLEYGRLSDGSFDITIGAVSSLWDFTAENPTVPDAAAIAEGLAHVDYTKVSLSQNEDLTYTVAMPAGTIIDLGAIAKGYIADKIKEYLLAHNINHAIINLGGNVLCVGSKRDNASFSIGVRKPFAENEYVAKLKIADMSVVSSGNYERYFYDSGTLYHHILNPDTGYPYDNGVSEVTIVSDDSLTGDCLSTTCFALGISDGLALIESIDGVEAMFVDTSGNVTYSSGFASYE
jgi:thiamine biosynthesis lipoprotein